MPTLHELTQEHGERLSLWPFAYIFEDGTTAHGDQYLVIQAPPQSEFGKLNAELRFLETKMKLETEAFNRFKAEMLEQAELHSRFPNNCPGVPIAAKTQLAAGQLRVKELRLKISHKKLRIINTPEGAREHEVKKQQLQQEQQHQQQHSTIVQELNEIAL